MRSILPGQHDDPVLGVPDSEEREVCEREVRVGDRLACQFPTIAVFIAHDSLMILYIDTDHDEPVRSADLCDMACDSVHDPIATALFSQVVGTVCE